MSALIFADCDCKKVYETDLGEIAAWNIYPKHLPDHCELSLLVVREGYFNKRLGITTSESGNAIVKALTAAGSLVDIRGSLFYDIEGKGWCELHSRRPTENLLAATTAVVVVPNDVGWNVHEWTISAANGMPERLRPRLKHVEYQAVALTGLPIEHMTAKHDRKYTRDVKGILQHPIAGYMGNEEWIFNHQKLPKVTTFKHLPKLFSGYELDAPSHVAAYSFLLAFFSGASLYADRPMLVVDSASQGRGKSQLCAAIAEILDGQSSSIPFRANDASLLEQVTSSTISRRTVIVDNVTDVGDWSSPTLSGLSTGAAEQRRKYEKGTSQLAGLCLMMNTVYGMASFGQDMAIRFNRVELHGPPKQLSLEARAFARAYPLELQSECYEAVKRTLDVKIASDSRFDAFDARGIAAYCEVFDADPTWALAQLAASRSGAYGLTPHAMNDLYAKKGDSFVVGSSPNVFLPRGANRAALTLSKSLVGARGLSNTLDAELSWS